MDASVGVLLLQKCTVPGPSVPGRFNIILTLCSSLSTNMIKKVAIQNKFILLHATRTWDLQYFSWQNMAQLKQLLQT